MISDQEVPLCRKLGSLFLSFVLLLSLLLPGQPVWAETEGGETGEKSQEESSLSQAAGQAKNGRLVVGMEANYAPYNWSQPDAEGEAVPIQNSPGEYANGYDVWMAKQIAQGLGKKLEIVKMEWDGLTPALMSGKIDAIIASMSPTAERKKQIDFSDPYYVANVVVVVAKDSPYAKATSLEELKGARITAQQNTYHYDSCLPQLTLAKAMPASDSFPTMITATMAGKVDGYISDLPSALDALAANPTLAYTHFEEGKGFQTTDEETALSIGLRKGDPDREEINRLLAAIPQDAREQAMSQMVDLNIQSQKKSAGEDTSSFWSGVNGLWGNYGSLFLRGAGITMAISLVGTAIGLLIGLLVQLLRLVPVQQNGNRLRNFFVRLIHLLMNIYVDLTRGTPMMVQAMLIFYGSKLALNIDMDAMFAGYFVVSLNTGAYLAETIRGGIESVDEGQFDAAQAMGLTYWQSMTRIILPQALKMSVPSIANELVVNVKDTSVLNVISVTELFFVTRGVAGSTYMIFQAYFITAVIYLVLTFATTHILSWILQRRAPEENYSLAKNMRME